MATKHPRGFEAVHNSLGLRLNTFDNLSLGQQCNQGVSLLGASLTRVAKEGHRRGMWADCAARLAGWYSPDPGKAIRTARVLGWNDDPGVKAAYMITQEGVAVGVGKIRRWGTKAFAWSNDCSPAPTSLLLDYWVGVEEGTDPVAAHRGALFLLETQARKLALPSDEHILAPTVLTDEPRIAALEAEGFGSRKGLESRMGVGPDVLADGCRLTQYLLQKCLAVPAGA